METHCTQALLKAIVIGTREGRQCRAHFIAGEVEAETCPGTRARIQTSAFLTKVGSPLENRRKYQTKVI